MVKLHLPHIYMFLFNFLIWRKYNDDYVFITIIVCFDYEFENEEGTIVFLLETPNSFGWALQPLLYWPWNKNGEEVDYKIREKERKTRDAPWSKPQKKQKVSLKKLERTQRIRGEGLERVAYDPKSVEKFGGIVE